jgi:hypothetical protein
MPLSRVLGLSEMFAGLAMVGGLVLGVKLSLVPWQPLGLPVTFAAVLALNGVGFLAALPVAFPSDVRRPEPPGPALAGFFRDCGRLYRHPPARYTLLAIAFLRGLVTVAAGAFIADALARGEKADVLVSIALFSVLGAAVGSLLAGLQGRPDRILGLVPPASLGLVGALVWAAVAPPVPWWLCVVVGVFGALVNVPLLAAYQIHAPADARGNAMAVLNAAGYLCMAVMSFIVAGLAHRGVLNAQGQLWLVAGLAGAGAVVAWVVLGRASVGQLLRPRGRRPKSGRFDHVGTID